MVHVVLTGGPSDHQPFIQAFRWKHHPGSFVSVTYNVNHSNTIDDLHLMFDRIMVYKPSVWILQEVKDPKGLKKYFRDHGFFTIYTKPEFMIAYEAKLWDELKHRVYRMASTEYWTINYALTVLLQFKGNGQRVEFMDYHPPAHVQSPKDPSFAKVSKVVREWKAKLDRIVKRRQSHHIEFCGAGDDNVDEFKGWAPKPDGWEFMLRGPKQIRPPVGTHGARKIDDFRISDGLTTT